MHSCGSRVGPVRNLRLDFPFFSTSGHLFRTTYLPSEQARLSDGVALHHSYRPLLPHLIEPSLSRPSDATGPCCVYFCPLVSYFPRPFLFFTLHVSITCIPPALLFFGAHSSLFGSHFHPLLKLQQHSQSTSSHLFAQMRDSLVAGSLLVAFGHCLVPRDNDTSR
jgi:hypothetical protein